MTSFINRTRRVLRSKQGSLVASSVFTVAAAILATGLLSLILAVTLISVSTTAHRGVVNSVAKTAEIYRGAPVSPVAEPCTGTPCSTVTEVTDVDGLRQVTIKGTGARTGLTLKQSLRPVEGTHISGFDAAGNPVWTTAGPAAKFNGYVNGGTK